MLSLTVDRDTFAARRRTAQTQLEAAMAAAVTEAVTSGDWDPVLDEAEEAFRAEYTIETGNPYHASLRKWRKQLADTLTKGTYDDPVPSGNTVALWVATYILTTASLQAAVDDPEDVFLEWVTMHDDAVRESHAATDGQTRPAGDPFDVDGVPMIGPGDVTAPVEEWIRCRCALRPVLPDTFAAHPGGTMTTTDRRPDGLGVPWHGPLAPEGVWTGDGRKFAEGSLDTRPLPIPLTWQKTSADAHDGNVTVASIEEAYLYEGAMWGTGHSLLTVPEADEWVGLLAEFGKFGVSVDADSTTAELDEDHGGVVYSEARVSSACSVPIPAFAEAWIALGPLPEEIRKKGKRIGVPDGDPVPSGNEKPPEADVPEEEMLKPADQIPTTPDGAPAIKDLDAPDDTEEEDPKKKKRDGKVAAAVAFTHASHTASTPGHGADLSSLLSHPSAQRVLQAVEWAAQDRVPELYAEAFAGQRATSQGSGTRPAPGGSPGGGTFAEVRDHQRAIHLDADEAGWYLSALQVLAAGDTDAALVRGSLPHNGASTRTALSQVQHGTGGSGDGGAGPAGGVSLREVSTEERKRLAEKNHAMPDGSFPIANTDDLKNAIQSVGRAKDPDAARAHIKRRAKQLGAEGLIPDGWTLDVEEFVKTEDGPGWLTNPVDTDRIRDYWVSGPGGAKIGWGSPGDFNRCRALTAQYVKPQHLNGYCANRHYDALGFWPGRPVAGDTIPFAADTLGLEDRTPAPALTLVAAGGGLTAPREWFTDPHLDGPTPLTINDDGHLFGHLATWDACHLDSVLKGECLAPPPSASGYTYMLNRGVVKHPDGSFTPVGQITLGGGHAGPHLSMRAAIAHYDDTGVAVADAAFGDDTHGIWFNGWIRPGTTDEQVTALRASALSGDWREMPRGSGQLEMIAALAVNVPGFGIPRTRSASNDGRPVSLVASGIITPSQAATDRADADLHAAGIDYDTLAQKIAEQMAGVDERRQKIAALAAALEGTP